MKKTSQGSPPDSSYHEPVLVSEVMNFLLTDPDGVYVDCTVGTGGHAEKILETLGANCSLYGIDADREAIAIASRRLERFGRAVKLLEKNFSDLMDLEPLIGMERVSGILFDLGISSLHIEDPERGFSYEKDGPLDMRFSNKLELTAHQIVNGYSLSDLTRVLREYGELREAKAIANEILDRRKKTDIRSTLDLVRVIEKRLTRGATRSLMRRVFQALRIEVNQELVSLKKGLQAGHELLKSGGVLVCISYHSLEDRIVKNFMRGKLLPRRNLLLGGGEVCSFFEVLTPRAVKPSCAEVLSNPRSRSARLRAGRRK